MRVFISFILCFLITHSMLAQLPHQANTVLIKLEFYEVECLLQWSTPKEVNSSYFIIEVSENQQAFRALNTVRAAGYSNKFSFYEYRTTYDSLSVLSFRISLVTMEGLRHTYFYDHRPQKPLRLKSAPRLTKNLENNVSF